MDVKVQKSKLVGSVMLPASKSVAHRVLIAAALSTQSTTVKGRLLGDDVFATIECLKSFAAAIDRLSASETIVRPFKKSQQDHIFQNAKESGSTLRFLLPIVCALGISATFVGEGRLAERPLSELLAVLKNHGITTDRDILPITVSGKLQAGEYIIQGDVSSQYITGLLFALPLLDGESTIEVVGELVSESYIDITLSVLKKFGVSVVRAGNMFVVKGNQTYHSPKQIIVESDWSSAGFFAVGGAVAGDVTLMGLDENSKQGDSVVIALLEKMGATISRDETGIRVKKGELSAIEFSAKDCPDIVPILSIALANANGVSKITDVERLRQKESDRIYAVVEMLTNLGIDAEYRDKALFVVGGKMKGSLVCSHRDHRIAMSAAIAGTVADGETTIVGAECVNKSYPTFFSDHKNLGGKNDASEF